MFIATIVVSVLLSALLIFSATGKIRRDPKQVPSLEKVGVKESQFNILAGLELAGAAGILLGLAWAPIGIAAGIGVVLYFVGAIVSHLRASDSPVAPMVPLLLAVAALVLRIVTL